MSESVMNPRASLDVLIAQIQIQLEQLGSLAVTSPLPTGSVERVAESIVVGLRARGISAGLYVGAAPKLSNNGISNTANDVREAPDAPLGFFRTFATAEAGSPRLARALLSSPDILTVASAPGILDEPTSLFLAAAADAVLLVAQAGSTKRADLARARRELETAGANLVGAVLLD